MDDVQQDDGTRLIKIEGCEYRVTKEQIVNWLECYGEVKSEIKEDHWIDENEEEEDGSNRSGIYSVLMKLERDIPELLPMYGRRIKIYHRGIQKFCKNCFGKHPTPNCGSQKVK